MAVELDSFRGDVIRTAQTGLSTYSAGDIYNAAEFLCLSDNPNVDLYSLLLHRFGDQLPVSDFNRNLSVVTAVTRNPTAPIEVLSARTGLSIEEIKQNQEWMQTSNLIKNALLSHYYPAYLFVRYTQSFLKDLVENPSYLDYVAQKKPIAPKRLEIHATNASCNYRCEMCLWHVQNQADYQVDTRHLTLLGSKDWENTLTQAKELGTDVVIISGGGESLLRSDVADVITHARDIGLYTMIYSNGSRLSLLPFTSSLYQAVLYSDWLRISLHATTENTYSQIVNLPVELRPLSKVIKGIERIRTDRDAQELPLRVGLGFVIQSLNYDQIEDIAQLSSNLGLDLLNLRVDCIDITERLTLEKKKQIYEQLRSVRRNFEQGKYGQMVVDFADSLIGPMNNWDMQPEIDNTKDCRVHYYRSAIDPYGRVAVCDLTAEPFYSRDKFTLGYINPDKDYVSVITEAAGKQFDASLCTSCMPGQQAINALWHKVLEDLKSSILPKDQPLLFRN